MTPLFFSCVLKLLYLPIFTFRCVCYSTLEYFFRTIDFVALRCVHAHGLGSLFFQRSARGPGRREVAHEKHTLLEGSELALRKDRESNKKRP